MSHHDPPTTVIQTEKSGNATTLATGGASARVLGGKMANGAAKRPADHGT